MWVRIEDTFYIHPKIVAVGDTAAGLHVRALSYCAHCLTDGFVPSWFVKGKLKTAEKLVLHGVWERVEGGFVIHDYLKYNPSKATIEAKRAADRSRKIPDGSQGGSAKIPYGLRVDSERRLRVRVDKASTSTAPSLSPPNGVQPVQLPPFAGLVQSVPSVSPTALRIESGRRFGRAIMRSEKS